MSDKIKNLSLKKKVQNQWLGSDMVEKRSEKMEEVIDDEVMEIIESCYRDAKNLLTEKLSELKAMAARLLDKEVLNAGDVKGILGEIPKPGEKSSKKKDEEDVVVNHKKVE